MSFNNSSDGSTSSWYQIGMGGEFNAPIESSIFWKIFQCSYTPVSSWLGNLQILRSWENSWWKDNPSLAQRYNQIGSILIWSAWQYISGIPHAWLFFRNIQFEFLKCSYLSNRSLCVALSDQQSMIKDVNFGVSQGSVLGAILFTTYINDMLQIRAELWFLTTKLRWIKGKQTEDFKTTYQEIFRDESVKFWDWQLTLL